MTTQQSFELAAGHHQAGRLREAELLYRQVLQQQPDHADALHLLGVLAHQINRPVDAVELIRRAIELNPAAHTYHSNLGAVLSSQGRLDDAITAHRRAVELQPDFADGYGNLAGVLAAQGQLEEAAAAYRRSLALRPDHAETRCNLGNILRELGQADEAMAELRRALALRPNFPEAYNNLGNVWHLKGDYDQAILAYGNALALRPDSADSHYNLGLALVHKGRLDEAIESFRMAGELRPDHAEAHYQLGEALRKRGRLDEAVAAYQRAVALRPDHAEAHNSLGIIFSERALVDEAIAAYRRAIAISPDFSGAYNNLGNALKDTGQISEAIACYRRSLELDPQAHVAGNLLYTIHFDPEYDARRIAQEHAEWNRTYARPLAESIRPHQNDASPDRRLRIGYVSHDLREHPVGRFLAPLLANHDHERFEIFCYCDVTRPDALTQRMRGNVDVWRDTVGMSDEALADLVREDQIDILVDLAMHMDGTRMLAFARKPVPVQVTYLAYCSTTGLETMDYRLTDPFLDPPGIDESVYCEKSVRLPRTYWCYEPPGNAPPVAPLPASASGQVTFGSLNNFGKVSRHALLAWMEIMRRVPESRLVLHCGEGSHRQRVLEQFSAQAIDPRRLRFIGRVSMDEYFQQYRQIDIALDSFPYPGGTTTCDALWMGVPVVTLTGPTAASRGGVSILSNVGLMELIAETTERYVQTAVALTRDPSRLAELRSTLRQRMASSSLMDAAQFARHVEAVFREMWRAWCVARKC